MPAPLANPENLIPVLYKNITILTLVCLECLTAWQPVPTRIPLKRIPGVMNDLYAYKSPDPVLAPDLERRARWMERSRLCRKWRSCGRLLLRYAEYGIRVTAKSNVRSFKRYSVLGPRHSKGVAFSDQLEPNTNSEYF